MEPAGFFEPSPRDNTNIESFTISPLNFHPDEPIKQNLLVTYSANDYEGLSATCEVRIEIEGIYSIKRGSYSHFHNLSPFRRFLT